MNEQEYIARLRAKNEAIFAAETIKIKTENLEKLLRNAFKAGQESRTKIDSLFDKMFGSVLIWIL